MNRTNFAHTLIRSRRPALLLLLGAALAASLAACSGGNDDPGANVREEASELADAMKDFGSKQRKALADRLQNGIDEADDRIDELQAKLEDSSDAAQGEARQALEDLKARRSELENWLGDVKDASADTWEDTREAANDAYQRMADALDDARAQL